MKHLSFLLVTLLLSCIAFSQPVTKQKTAVTKPATLQTPAPNKPAQRIPDLKITSATVIATSTGNNSFKFTITCTIKNDGIVAINYNDVAADGKYVDEANSKKDFSFSGWKNACGSGLGLLGNGILQPGSSATLQFLCSNNILLPNTNYVYALAVSALRGIQELSVDNNRIDVPIVIQ